MYSCHRRYTVPSLQTNVPKDCSTYTIGSITISVTTTAGLSKFDRFFLAALKTPNPKTIFSEVRAPNVPAALHPKE